MNQMGIPEPAVRRLWSRQSAVAAAELERDGVYRPKEEYIRKKNDTISDFYLKLYRWYTAEAGKYMQTAGSYPVWMSLSEEHMLQPVEDTVIFCMEIPCSEYLLCNYDAWGYVVNYFYVPLNEEDRLRHEQELKKYGVGSDDELLLTQKGNFYPLLKRELTDSWKRVFTLPPRDEIHGAVATAWEIRKEWGKEIRRYD